MSTAQIQKRKVFEEITRLFFASGENPRLLDILARISEYFSMYPAGQPLPMPIEYVEFGARSNVAKINEANVNTTLNLDVLYEACLEQAESTMMLTTLLKADIERLGARRKKLEADIDDHLFSLYNTDGYYFSVSDVFADISKTDLTLTSAFIDTVTGLLMLPSIPSETRRMEPGAVSAVDIRATLNGESKSFVTKATFNGALDSLTNTVWSIEFQSDKSSEAVVVVNMVVGTTENPIRVSRIELDPFGIIPVQAFIEVLKSDSTDTYVDFGSKIQTSASKMAFIDIPLDVKNIRITLRKTSPDYNVIENNIMKYNYIFGLKDIFITEHAYNSDAIFVSQPLRIAEDLASDNIIDAVALVVQENTPADTTIDYFVASDVDLENPTLGDFTWKRISPLGSTSNSAASVIKFDGALNFTKYIRTIPAADGLQLIPLDNTNPDLRQRNPSDVIIPAMTDPLYRIAAFSATVLPESIKLDEGINSTRILHTALASAAVDSLEYWSSYVNGTATVPAIEAFGEIDIGNGFFYGGDVGDSGRSVYVETYLWSDSDQELILKEISKVDSNSKTWAMKVFLNGREVGNLPLGTDRLTIPWKFQEGLNHICIVLNIPEPSESYPYPYIGTIDLMKDDRLPNFGDVRLGTWNYIDPFHLQYNEVGSQKTFSIVDGEIVTRRKPTINYRLQYSTPTNSSPTAVRVRADLTRSFTNPHVTPSLDSYRLRFLYGETS